MASGVHPSWPAAMILVASLAVQNVWAAPASTRPATTAEPTALPAGLALVTVDRRKVAIVDLTGDAAGTEDAATMARTLSERLVAHAVLAPIPDPAIAAALLGPPREEDQQALANARRALADANDALARFELAVAAARAAAGQAELGDVEPTASSISLYADLAFVHGQAKLADSDGPAARSSFLLTQRLDPDRVIDPARYLPDVISAYRQARRGGSSRMQIEIRGQGAAFVDGVEIGVAPLTIEVATGPHLVQLAGPRRLTRGARIEITPTSPAVVVLPDATAALPVIIGRTRRALTEAVEETARAEAMAELARLIGIGDALILERSGEGLTARTWRNGRPGFGAPRPLPSALLDSTLLDELAPNTAVPRLVLPGPSKPVDPEPWYQKRWVQASVLTGAAVIAAAVVLRAVTTDPDTVPLDRDPSF